jgi:protein-tyrosine phosphatase
VFTIVFVCTGNRCRSPSAEGFTRALARGLPVEVTSAGTLDLGEVPALAETVAAARAFGVDLSTHKSRAMVSAGLERADLIVGFELDHVAAAVVEGNARRERTFTLPEIVRLLEGVAPAPGDLEERARAAVAGAHRKRMEHDAFVPREEVPDPIGRPPEVHEQTANTVMRLCERLIVGLFGRSGSSVVGVARDATP